ncbi:LytR C-terminal domain-containing protein [Nocardioides sp. MAHUQ-72]|uniref:LytR C-terminal domain-containing protein n=1 Tax=unclassified Nocardioides TaxID=2615069 RepID=UPI003620311E
MRVRDQRGVVFPSPVVMLSIIAVAMAGIAYVATRGGEPTEREVTTVSRAEKPAAEPSAKPSLAPEKPRTIKPEPPAVVRSKVYVEVYNNSGITGLAGSVASRASGAGWQVVGSDNWYGTIPATTVYYPQRLKAAAKVLALDLGVDRTAPAVDPMRLDRLTVILTGPLG